MLEKLGGRCERIIRNYMPDPFAGALLLTIFGFGLATWVTPTHPTEVLSSWYSGFWDLLSLSMQILLIVVTGEAIAETRLIKRLLQRLCALPHTASGATFFLAFTAIVLGWLHWGMGLIGGALIGRQLGRSLTDRKIAVHYPVLGAAAYMSTLLWEAGPTASIPLLVSTAGHSTQQTLGVVPLSETVFRPANLILCAFFALFVPWLVSKFLPRRNISTIDTFVTASGPSFKSKISEEKPKTFAEKLEKSYLTNAIIGGLGLVFVVRHFQQFGPQLKDNTGMLLLLMIGLLLHRNPVEYSRAVRQSMRGTAGIVLLFPFYGGILAILRDSGLGQELTLLFIQMSTADTLPLLTYLATTCIKLFVPFVTGEWVIEAPVVAHAAKELNASSGLTTLAVAYGNMVGNMFQPFWAIPLLSIMGLRARDIMGYCLAVFCFVFPALVIALAAA